MPVPIMSFSRLYEYTSSYLSGSDKGPAAIVRASQYVELYDEELDMETYRKAGIATLKPLDFKGRHDKKAVDFIEEQTSLLLKDKKFVVSLYKPSIPLHSDL